MTRQTRCAVCGRAVDPLNAVATATDDARTYYFCSTACRDALLNDPGRYVVNTGN
ncbi:MAG: hypothetical protein KIT69_11355 [Propionibacteriaceae bacterium]|nr:hypothetical protein [Propionibacteriaceae bacterium]